MERLFVEYEALEAAGNLTILISSFETKTIEKNDTLSLEREVACYASYSLLEREAACYISYSF
jgi:hypothetical protein